MNVSHFPQTPHPEQLEQIKTLLAPFPVVRFMNWQQINHFTWAKRPPVCEWHDLPSEDEDWGYKTGSWQDFPGVPLSVMVNLANEIGSRPWFNIPHAAHDDCIRHMLAYIVNNSDQKPIIEYSNEVWNGMFQQHGDVKKMGADANITSKEWEMGLLYQAKQTRMIAEFVQDSAETVISGQFFNPNIASILLDACSDVVDAFAVAPYIGRLQRATTNRQVDLATELKTEIDDDVIPLILQYKALCDAHGVELYAYEGGLHQVARNDSDEATFETEKSRLVDFNRSEAANEVTAYLWHLWRELGGSIACPYSLNTIYYNAWNSELSNTFFGHCEVEGREITPLPKYEGALVAAG